MSGPKLLGPNATRIKAWQLSWTEPPRLQPNNILRGVGTAEERGLKICSAADRF